VAKNTAARMAVVVFIRFLPKSVSMPELMLRSRMSSRVFLRSRQRG
jgi:hypothetical protein